MHPWPRSCFNSGKDPKMEPSQGCVPKVTVPVASRLSKIRVVSKSISVFSPSSTRLRRRTSGNSTRVRTTNPWVSSSRKYVPCAPPPPEQSQGKPEDQEELWKEQLYLLRECVVKAWTSASIKHKLKDEKRGEGRGAGEGNREGKGRKRGEGGNEKQIFFLLVRKKVIRLFQGYEQMLKLWE